MLDNALIALIIKALLQGEAVASISGLPIQQAFQPTQQGVPTGPTAAIVKVSDHRYGWLKYADYYDSAADPPVIVHKEVQRYKTTFQLNTLATQNPAAQQQYTASDLANLCASILQSQPTVAFFQANNVGIERITDVSNIAFQDDRQQNQFSPAFTFVMVHKQTIVSTTPVINAEEFDLYSI